MPATPTISKRTLLVAALLLGQLVCVLVALMVFGRWLESGLTDMMRRRTLETNQQFGEQVARMIERTNPADLEPASEASRPVRDLLETMDLPHGAALGLVDLKTGNVVAHSQADDARALNEAALSAAADPARVAQWTALPDGSQMLLVRRFDALNAALVAHQPTTGLNAIVLAFVQRMRLIGVVVAVVLVALGAALNVVILRAYDNRVASANERLEYAVEQRSHDVVRSRDAVIFGLAMLAEQRDGETGEHLERISEYTAILASHFTRTHPQYDERWVHTLRVTSTLHDIGKVAIPDAVLRKPDALTEHERKIIQQHPYIGGDTLLELKRRWGEDLFLNTAAQICLGHHERWDGGGYPFGLKGEEIPLPARIVALADVYDALTSRRHYKERMTHMMARQMIVGASGTQFDPQVVEAFLACEAELEKVAFHPRREVLEESSARSS